MEPSVIPLVFVFGPTGVGKTDLLIDLFAADNLRTAEIISADSMQVYRSMDIGSAKPSRKLLEALPHHLIDIRNPDEQFHVGDFVTLAEGLIPRIAGAGRIPVVSGGTAFYFRNLMFGMPLTPPGDPVVRERILERESALGLDGLYCELSRIDPESAARIQRNDRYRIVRSLEVYYVSGLPLSSYPVPEVPRRDLRVLVIGLERPREELYARIEVRVQKMFEMGLCSEVNGLLEMGYSPDDPGFRGIGYREFLECFRDDGGDPTNRDQFLDWIADLDEEGLSRLRARISLDSRHYAKRQITFFCRIPGIRWYNPEDREGISLAVTRFREELAG